MSVKQVRGEYWEVLGVVEVDTPIGNGEQDEHGYDVASGDIDDGEEGADQRAAEVGGDDRPVEREGPDPEASHA